MAREDCSYCEVSDVKDRPGEQWTSGVKYDDILEDWIASASRLIDMELRWGDCHFAISDVADLTRRFDTEAGTEMFIDECVAITTLTIDTNGDGTPDTIWTEGVEFVVDPYNEPSFNRILVKEDASVTFPTGQRRMEIVGLFGGFATPPQLIKEACAITVIRWFKRALQAYQDTGAIVELGQLTYTKALDPDVKEILAQYGRRLGGTI